ncbi:MAG: hypothetical protein P8Z42_10845 [Anaerolineales bacterium]|jgi:hypothetical protein
MSKADFEIALQGGEADGVFLRFKPGETMQGSVQVTPQRDMNCRHLLVRLIWQTEGRGDRDHGVGGEIDLFQGKLQAGTPRYHSFHFRLPDEPWSYAGHYINIVWRVEVSIDLAMTVDPRAAKPFILVPA